MDFTRLRLAARSLRSLAGSLATGLLGVAMLACGSEPARDVVGSASSGLVLVRPVGAQSDLYRARLADGAVRPFLTSADREEVWPCWSDAGARLVFQHRPAGREAPGPPDHQVGREAPGPPDHRAGGSGYDLSLWDPRSNAERPLAATPARDEQWPAWSPQGDRVVFAYRDGTQRGGLAWIDVETGVESLLAASGPRDLFFRPSFAEDGRRVVAQRHADDGAGSTLWIAALGTEPHRLTSEDGWFEQKPFFARDGSVVFTRERGDAPREVVRATADGAVTPLPGTRHGADEHAARPSPTRDEVAFVSDRDGTRDVFLGALNDGTPRNLTHSRDRDEYAPRWSPDGERLVLTVAPPHPRGRDGDRVSPAETRLVVIDREGRVQFETDGMMADWMPAF